MTKIMTIAALSSISFGAIAQGLEKDNFFTNQNSSLHNDSSHKDHHHNKCSHRSSSKAVHAQYKENVALRIQRKLEKIANKLDLTPNQKTQLATLMKNKAHQKHALRKKYQEQLRQILTAEQHKKLHKHKKI